MQQLGPEAVQAYQRQLLAAAVDCLVAAWGTGVRNLAHVEHLMLPIMDGAPCKMLDVPSQILLTPPPCVCTTGTLVPLSMCGAMALVELPLSCVAAAQKAGASGTASTPPPPPPAAGGSTDGSSAATSADAKWVQDTLHYQHRIECPVKCVGGRLYMRISGERRSCFAVPAAQPGQYICICLCFVCSSP